MRSLDDRSAGALRQLWQAAGGAAEALQRVRLTGADPVLPSSFAVGSAAQASLAAGALAATELGRLRNGVVQQLAVDMRHAALEACTHFLIDGQALQLWDKLSGLYPCGGDDGTGGWVRIHANFAHHRDGALRLLGLPEGSGAEPADVRRALQRWNAYDFEQAAADAGLVVAALRRFEDWDRHPQGQAVTLQPLLQWTRLGDAPSRALPPLPMQARPLQGLRVLDLTRILAGPVGTRALAAHGADVLLVNSPRLPNIEALAETSRGKLSAHADLREPADREAFERVLADAHVLVQGYRPGALQRLGYGAEALAERHPGIVVVSLSAYGASGPWSDRRGFDSLVQTASGFNHAEALAFGSGPPRALPMQILDHATGHLMTLGACAAVQRQQRQGGSWHVQVSLARTGHWLRGLGQVPDGFAVGKPEFAPYLDTGDSGFGRLSALRHAALLSATPAGWDRPSMPPGSHPLAWPPTDGPRR
jgi:crotonobetainyl-CoA:carnitine CoA-transferase CaiB-like acyl-CoA transferase